MPPWWGKSSSKEVKKKANKESFIDTIHRKFKISSEEKCSSRTANSQRHCNDTASEKGSLSHAQSLSPSTQVSRCQSFAERPLPQPLPLPGVHLIDTTINASTKPGLDKGSKPSIFLPLPGSGNLPNRPDPADAYGDLATASVSSDGYIDSDDPSESRLLSPHASDCENGNRTAMNSPSSVKLKEQSPAPNQKTSREMLKLDNNLWNNQTHPASPKQQPLRNHVPNLHIPLRGAVCSAPDSSMSSPSRSPMRVLGHELVMNSGFWAGKTYPDVALLGSGQCSSPGSGHNSGHNSVGGDMSGQGFWPHSRCSPECSPMPSPRMTSPGPSSRIHSGAVTPLHPRVGLTATETPANWSDEKKQQSHRLPLPPLTISNSCPFSPSYSTSTTPLPRSPGRAETPTSPCSRWKKGRLLGRGTFGHVYLGFNSSGRGEMCAMKEVTLFSDDAKSKESAQQLGQEIALLSRLRHPNIVQYYGSETVDDKLYIYLEYVSGGSIYKILQDYGPLGEIAIRSYTQQILAGLAYLHAKNTIHRDIKGANILVDPNGRVKLADFGMAKHISGQSCPLSFKGSPYWMAPEVIKNPNGCNLAVDVWSLGCTVLEMASGKPPWSQYEGVAALFKIGNSKELPAIPEHLSDEGKDFVMQCLQRNPSRRPTASKLLEHPFVNNAATFERPILNSDPSEPPPAVTIAARSQGMGHTNNVSCLDPEGMAVHHPRRLKTSSGFSDAHAHVPMNKSCPVSPIGSPLLHPRSPQHMSGIMSPSPISSPRTASGASTPLTGGGGATPFHLLKQPTYSHEGMGTISRAQNNLYSNVSPSYHGPEPDLFCGNPQTSHVFQELVSSENGFQGNQYPRKPYNGQLVLADRVSQQLLRDHVKLNPLFDLNPGSPVLGRTNGI